MKWKSNVTGKIRKKPPHPLFWFYISLSFAYSTPLHIVREGAVAAHKDVDILTGQSRKSMIVGPCKWDAVIIYIIITPVLLPLWHVKLPLWKWYVALLQRGHRGLELTFFFYPGVINYCINTCIFFVKPNLKCFVANVSTLDHQPVNFPVLQTIRAPRGLNYLQILHSSNTRRI